LTEPATVSLSAQGANAGSWNCGLLELVAEQREKGEIRQQVHLGPIGNRFLSQRFPKKRMLDARVEEEGESLDPLYAEDRAIPRCQETVVSVLVRRTEGRRLGLGTGWLIGPIGSRRTCQDARPSGPLAISPFARIERRTHARRHEAPRHAR
jgi:hypothetical protein